MEASNRTSERSRRLETVLRAQDQRIVAALRETAVLDARPILRDDEILYCEEYVTLVYELHHVVLPELAAAGLVQFDREADVVTRGERFEAPR